MRPTPEYLRRHEIDAPRIDARAFRQGWRVRSRLDGLLAERRITPGAWQAACDFRTRWAKAFPARVSSFVAAGRASVDPHCAMLDRVAAVTRIRALGAALGPARLSLLVWVVVDDLSWRDLGRRLRCHHETARDAAAGVLQALARVAESLASRSGDVLGISAKSDPIRTRRLHAFRQCAKDFANLAESDHGAAIAAPSGAVFSALHMAETAEPILQFFAFDHLPEPLQAVSQPFGVLAQNVVVTLPRNPERTVALRKLLEAKDAAVRALIYKT